MTFHLKPVRVKTGSHDTEGQLVFAAGFLVAVLVRLSDDHEEDAGKWFLEAGFDGADDPVKPKFADLREAQDWIRHRLDRH
ncbi:hypothetical protein VQ03_04230 [Methylobacterium tarhaniae]|uniref:Uncharacterized protein n=1 Tax=Methylobacterium tarhaniae TaxID=1187852 RepID=A0A0J6TA18_9HYPH|nr:hypothetical protein [Methylobacterium tarhaniae]KMO44150.1 hypothetical protein VQ03_04230 [Methylobacterium tarhaniae]